MNMNSIKTIFRRLTRAPALRIVRPVTDTIDGVLFGSEEITTVAPHLLDSMEIKRYMGTVIIALLPSALASIYFFGWYAVKIIIVAYVAGGLTEVLFRLVRKREIEEGFLVTGLIFPLILPPTVPLWVVAVGVAFGVFFGKEAFGGTGRNIFNPALVGRLFITIAFPQIMSASWRVPFSDAFTAATPLGTFKSTGVIPAYSDLLLGQTTGSMGELFRIGIIAGGLFLMITKVSNWRIPLTYLGTVFIFSWIGNAVAPMTFAPPLFQLLSGGLLFGAMFMATDPVTSPATTVGKYIYGFMCGILTILIRNFSGFTEGVMFSIVFMNALTPLVDHLVVTFRYRLVQK